MQRTLTPPRIALRFASLGLLALLLSPLASAQHVLEFDEFGPGDVVSAIDVQGCGTITVEAQSGSNPGCDNNAAVIYDSDGTGGPDPDLEVGEGNVLIIHHAEPNSECEDLEDGHVAIPNDDRNGGTLTMTFPQDVTFCSLLVIDDEEVDDYIYLLDAGGNVLEAVTGISTGDGGKTTVTFEPCVEGVRQLVMEPIGSRAWDDITFFCETPGGGCSLTQGYWKTHSEFGPAPYDETWALVGPDGASTPFFGTGLSWYAMFWTSPSGGNAYVQLAHQWMAAKLNQLNGADVSVINDGPGDVDWPGCTDGTLQCAEDLLAAYTHTSNLPNDVKRTMRQMAGRLADYNEGDIGPGHCGNDVGESATSQGATAPAAYALAAAYPNPFEARTSVSVSLPETAAVTVSVYDVLGREVARLAEGTFEAGEHTVTWDAQGAPNGTYVVVFQAGTFRQAQTVVLAR